MEIQSTKVTIKKHEMYMVNKHKIALNKDHDERYVQADAITTSARGSLP